ncbi:uncharacterized protein LOC143279336 [Babylonia areolata]|uniref:uncharacterized protein LOC143279336 n=1 Tax=Babylonia areolata TaxID=304850 RepID=UPI003FD07240
MADNDSFTFDDEGNPVPSGKPPSAKKPPAAPRKSRSRKRAGVTSTENKDNPSESFQPKTNGANADGEVASRRSSIAESSGEEIMTDMFHIDGTGYDVTLSLRLQKICWETMNPSGRRRTRSGSLSGLFRRRKSSSGLKDHLQNSIDLNKIFGARIKRRRKPGQSEEEGFVLGLGLFTLEHKDANTFREREIYFEHPSVEICTRWSEKLNNFINSLEGRPKNVKLFLQPYAGDKNGRSIFKHKILPLFQNAGVATDVTIIQHNEHVKQEMIHLNIHDFDCVIAMGGDGTVSQVLNGLMNRSQKEQEVDMKRGHSPARALVPMGIIPIGKTNQVAGSVMGTIDPITAALHIVYGHWSPMDVCSVFSLDKFHCWAFNCQYGFAGNVLLFMKRYATLGRKRIDAAFMKALTSSKLRAYECDIEFIPTPGVIAKEFNTTCRTGCERCLGQSAVRDRPEVTTDVVQELNLNNSISSCESTGSVIELKQDSPWQTLKGSFMNIAVFSIPGNGEIAPQGLSKVTHLNDGNMDLVIVRAVERKEFLRYLRRHGNSKNQYDFPFVEVHRCKEVRFRPRMPISWNYNDHDFSEIKYQMSKQEMMKKQQMQRHRSVEIIDELDSSQTKSSSMGLQAKSVSMYALDDSEEEEEEDDVEEIEDITEGGGDKEHKEKSAAGGEQSGSPKYQYVGPQYQPTWTEQEIARRKMIARKKEEKKKAKEQEKSKSVWNMDNEICVTLDLEFKVHSGLLMVCGQGISPHTEFDDVRFTCLPGRS